MNDRLKLPIRFNPDLLKSDLTLLEQSDWIPHFVRRNYDGDWSVLPLRGPAGETHPVRMIYSDPSCTRFADTPFLEECEYFKTVLTSIRSPLETVRLMKLSQGSRIKEHCDHDLTVEEGIVRLHIPVRTNPDVHFFLNRKQVVMQEGECWYLRLSDPHSVENNGRTDRVHLVIDVRVNEWLLEMMKCAHAEVYEDDA